MKIKKTVVLIGISFLTMANKECKEATPEVRQLKKNIILTGVESSSFMDSSQFNFSEQATERMLAALLNSKAFYYRKNYPTYETYINPEKFNIYQQSNIQSKMNAPSAISIESWFGKPKSVNAIETSVQLDTESRCFIERPQHVISGKILSLEAHSGIGLVFGFNQSVSQLPLQASLSIDRMKMDMAISAIDPWSVEIVQSQIVSILKKNLALKFGIDLGVFHIGPQLYRKTGLAEFTTGLVNKSIEQMSRALESTKGQEWKSRVIINNDNFVGILGGEELGIKVGDQFIIENENHLWKGEPCANGSVVVASIPVTVTPWVVEVDRVGMGITRAKVLNENEFERMRIGASVKIKKLVESKTTAPGP